MMRNSIEAYAAVRYAAAIVPSAIPVKTEISCATHLRTLAASEKAINACVVAAADRTGLFLICRIGETRVVLARVTRPTIEQGGGDVHRSSCDTNIRSE